jgi:hypothetical protein
VPSCYVGRWLCSRTPVSSCPRILSNRPVAHPRTGETSLGNTTSSAMKPPARRPSSNPHLSKPLIG